MARNVPRWLMVCGIAAVAVVVAIAALLGGSFLFLRDTVRAFESADEGIAVVVEQHGPIQEFRPDPAGTIPTGRLEAFLAAREGMATAREELEASLKILDSGNGSGDESAGTFRKAVTGFGLPRQLSAFIARRNETLLQTGMGYGEYYYIYTVAYYSWLGRSPADGTSFRLVGEHGYVLENAYEELDEFEAREHRMDVTRTSLNRSLLPMLRSQLADLDAAEDADLQHWKDALAAEIAALEADPHHLPWEGRVPESIAASLQPYRQGLESSYSPLCNEMEVGLARR